MTNDVRRAFFHARATRDVCVQLPDEDRESGQEKFRGKFNYSMYGARDVAMNWQAGCSQRPVDNGFNQGIATPCAFYRIGRGIRILVRGRDYVSMGQPGQSTRMGKILEQKYQIKTQILGPGEEHVQEVEIQNRCPSWGANNCIIYEADPRHVEIIVELLKFVDAKGVTTPGIKKDGSTIENNDEKLADQQASKYRAFVARCNYLSPDLPDVVYSAKGLARDMSSPSRGNGAQQKRLG